MLKNYLKTAWRSLIRGKGFSVINIAGLAVGMAGAVLILLWLQNEISFDTFHTNKNRLYQVYGLTGNTDGHPTAIEVTSQPLVPYLKRSYPEIEDACRVSYNGNFLVTANNKSFTGIEGCFVDPSFLQMFSFPLTKGNKNDQLKNVYSITITEKLALKIFGTRDAIGKIIKIDSVDNFTVTGVLKDLPSNTRFDFEYLLPWEYYDRLGHGWATELESWLSNNTYNYVLLKPNTDFAVFNNKIKDVTRHVTGRNDIWTHFLYPLSQWHLYSDFENGKPAGGRISTVRTFGLVAAFILLIACINFMNLSTARSEQRAKEVGIRKIAGAGKGLLVGQFISEAFLTALMAGFIALLIVANALPLFNRLIETQLTVPYTSIQFWLLAVGFIFITSLLAGSYPAFYLSSFKPVSILKKEFRKSRSVLSPRKILVVTQFTFAIVLIICSIVIRNQVMYAQQRDKGYSMNNLVQVNFAGDIEKNFALIKKDLLDAGIASSVTKTMNGITQGGAHTWGLRWQGEIPEDTNTTITMFSADADLVKTAGLQLIEGRDIDINKYPADSFAVLLNETAVKLMGFNNPIGQIIRQPYNNATWHVTGVVKNYVAGSPFISVPPTVILGAGAWFTAMHIKFSAEHTTGDNLARAAEVFKKYNPVYPFDYKFVDQQYARQFDNEQRTKTMAGIFAALAIFISCLGLFGLSAYVAESRTKEIGVRKVLGASAIGITTLLSADFIKLVAISIVLATPIAWWAMNKWLSDYQYKITIGWDIFAVAGLLAIVIAVATISFQSVKAALANPVKSLRTE